MKICVIGLGYIGLPTALMFSSHGCEVIGIDKKEEVVNLLNHGNIHICEPGLEKILKRSIDSKKFYATTTPQKADTFIIAVPTPNKDDKYLSCDLSYVLQACEDAIPYIGKGNTVIIESTIAPRSTDDYIKPLFEKAGFIIGKNLYLAHCPERVLPGNILYELENNNRVVGGVTPLCAEKAAKVYNIFVKGEIIKTEAKTAELAKCMENTFRDVNIALANELTKICYDLSINCLDVINIANKHPRVNIHKPGPGVGGHCLAIDPYFIYSKAPELAKVIKTSRDVNSSMPRFVFEKIEKLIKNNKNNKITIFGVAYKGEVDDIRESPALKVVDLLKENGYNNLKIYDPYVKFKDYTNLENSVMDSNLVVILTDHDEFKNINYDKLSKLTQDAIIFDTKNIIDINKFPNLKIFNYGNIIEYEEC